jgi:hypothetical protein
MVKPRTRHTEKYVLLIICSCFLTLIGLLSCSKYEEKVNVLTSTDSQGVVEFKIYPRVIAPAGIPVEFSASDQIVDAFFQSLKDIHPYPTSRDTIASWDYNWFLEVYAKGWGDMIQIKFYIPSRKGDVVVGTLGEFHKTGGSHDGQFQSQQLYHWYQKYSHRWLEPEEAPPTPTPQADPPDGE